MKVSLIAAVAENGAIGKDNDLIWKLPSDLKFFQNTTMGHAVIMGRKNYDSIPDKWRPLNGRDNVIVTRQSNYESPGAYVVNELKTALKWAQENGEEEAFIIGGGQIYKLALDMGLIDTMYITHVHGEFEADVFFPEWNKEDWNAEFIAEHGVDEKHAYPYSIFKYLRK